MIHIKRSIRFKLMRVIMITSASVLLLTFAFFFLYEFLSYQQITVRQLNTLGQIVASNSTAALAFKSNEEAHEILSALKAARNIDGACIYDKEGNIFSMYPPDKPIRNFPQKPGEKGFKFTQNRIEGFIPIEQNGMQLGVLYLTRNLNDFYERIVLYSFIALIVFSISIVFVYLLSLQLQKGISSPIVGLAETTRQISLNNNYSIRAEKKSDDEIGSLTDSFNNMIAQIEIQNKEIEAAREAAAKHAVDLEIKVNERTIQLKREKDFAEVVVNSSLVLISVYDMDTRIIAYNNKCADEFGLTKNEVLGKKYLEAFPKVEGTLTHTSLLRALGGEIIHNIKYQSGVTGNYYESYMVPLRDEDNKVYAVLMTANNITQLVKSSEELITNNLELQRKNEQLEQFAYVASHDLQEPLRKIRTFSGLAKGALTNLEKAEKYLDKIDSSSERMSTLIRDVLQYSKLSNLQDEFTNVNLNTVLNNVKFDFELLIEQRSVQIQNDTLPIIKGNELQMHQLFSNLINNSIKFCNSNPKIKIILQPILPEDFTALANKDLKYIKLLFIDNGIGFAQEYAEKVFAIFQRLNTREKYEGTGIGLALCKKIIQNHNGSITVTSIPDVGTTFSIILPVT